MVDLVRSILPYDVGGQAGHVADSNSDQMVFMKKNKKCAEPKFLAVWLHTTTWVGICVTAEHYYGKLVENHRGPGKSTETDIKHALTRKEAERINEKNEYIGIFKVKTGAISNEFETRERVRAAGIKLFRKQYPGDAILIDGTGSLSARPLLAWPKWFDAQAKRVNDLATEWERIGGYEGNEKRAGQIDNEWQKLLVEFIGEYH